MPQTKKDLDKTGDTGRSRRMPHVGFDGSHRTELFLVGKPTVCIGQGIDFHRVSQLGSGPVGFDIIDGFRMNAEFSIDRHLEIGLRKGAGCGNSIGFTVLIDTGALDDPVDVVSIRECGRQRFEHHQPDPLTGYETVCPLVECLAEAIG